MEQYVCLRSCHLFVEGMLLLLLCVSFSELIFELANQWLLGGNVTPQWLAGPDLLAESSERAHTYVTSGVGAFVSVSARGPHMHISIGKLDMSPCWQ